MVQREIRRIFAATAAAQRHFLRRRAVVLERVIMLVSEALAGGHTLFFFGNGGSAADAQHLAAEFVNRYKLSRPPLPAVALTTDTSALTSIANDYGYAEIFAKQLRALGRPGDVAFALSTSGNAANVLRAVAVCRKIGIATVGITGGKGGKLAARVDHLLCVDGTADTARVQETHILIGHVICELVERALEQRPAAPVRASRSTRAGKTRRGAAGH